MLTARHGISYNDTMKPKKTLARFDPFLAKRGLVLEAVVVGGAALGLLDVISRETRDCDILHPELSEEIRDAAAEFAAQVRARGDALADDWLNRLNRGPISLGAPAHRKHRVEWTTPDEPTVWLTVFYCDN